MEQINKKKVLVVDDDNNLMTVLVDKLNFSGFDAISAPNGEEGLHTALTNHPDLILLDIIMPKMSGWEMLDELRKDEWGKKAKVIMLTALENSDHVAQAVEKETAGYLVKTNWSLDDVVKQVKEAMEKN